MVFKPANCPNCGGSLQIPDDRDTVNCMYCNTTIVVKEVLKVAIKSNLQNLFRLADAASEAGNYDESYNYYTQILEEDGNNSKAWFGKGVAAGWQSNLLVFRFPEMLSSFQKAIEYASNEERNQYISRAADSINSISVACYYLSREHLDRFVSLHDSWSDYIDSCSQIISSLEIANEYAPSNREIVKSIILICKDNIEGVFFFDDSINLPITRSLSQERENILKTKLDEYVSMLQRIDPSYKPPQIKKARSCFVVTATMGCENNPRVAILRQFRDVILLRTEVGKQVICLYSYIGPQIASIIQGSWFLRQLSYLFIVLPASEIARKVLSNKSFHTDAHSSRWYT